LSGTLPLGPGVADAIGGETDADATIEALLVDGAVVVAFGFCSSFVHANVTRRRASITVRGISSDPVYRGSSSCCYAIVVLAMSPALR
jgi:hypothetical protein